MACLFTDSFDYYTTAQGGRKWIAAPLAIGTTYGRNGGQGARICGGGISQSTVNLGVNATTLITGVAMKVVSVDGTNGGPIMEWYDNATIQFEIRLHSDGSIKAYGGSGATTLLGSSAPGVMPSYSTVHNSVQAKIVFHNSTGSIIVKVNNATVLTLTGIDTVQSANAYCNQMVFGNPRGGTGVDQYIDDLWIFDTTGSTCNDFAGDLRVEALRPTAAGATTQFTPLSGNNWDNVDDATTDDETSYVSSSTVGHKDTYATANLTSTLGAVLAVVMNTVDRKDDSGTRTHSHVVGLSGTELTGAAFSPTTAYANHQTVFETKPGGGAWTIADVNNMEIGHVIAS